MRVSRRVFRAFTLLEMVVVLTILAVLMGIAYVTWSTFLSSSRHTTAGAALDRVVTVEEGLSRDWGSYTVWPSDLADVGGSLTVTSGGQASTGPSTVSLAVGSSGSLGLAVLQSDGKCQYLLLAPLSSGAAESTPAGVSISAACTGAAALPAGDSALTQTQSIKTSGS